MNRAAIAKHEINNNLADFSEHDLNTIASFIDFMRYKKKIGEKKLIRLEDILSGYDIDFSELEKFRQQTWQHVDREFVSG